MARRTIGVVGRAQQPKTHHQGRDAEYGEPADVPKRGVRNSDPYAVNSYKPVNEHDVGELPDAEAENSPCEKKTICRPRIALAPQQHQSERRHTITGEMKQAIRQDLRSEVVARYEAQEV